jgi:hypothetical protein
MVQPERRGEVRERETRLAAEDEEREERAFAERNQEHCADMRSMRKALASRKAQD